MKKFIKLLSCIVVISMILSVGAFAAFSDMPDGEKGAVIDRAVKNGLLTGFEDGTVRPDAPITRAQMATIMTRALNATAEADLSAFGDVNANDWYYSAMAKAVYMEAFKGDGANLNPNNNITRQEAMIVLSRIFDMPFSTMEVIDSYDDGNKVSVWAKNEVSRVITEGYVEKGGKLRPLDPMTRYEFAELIDNIITTYITEDGEYSAKDIPAGNILVKANNVSLNGVKNDRIFISDGVSGKVTLNGCEIERIVVRGGQCVLASGKYSVARAIGAGSTVNIINLFKNGGMIEEVYGKPGKGTVFMPSANVDIQK